MMTRDSSLSQGDWNNLLYLNMISHEVSRRTRDRQLSSVYFDRYEQNQRTDEAAASILAEAEVALRLAAKERGVRRVVAELSRRIDPDVLVKMGSASISASVQRLRIVRGYLDMRAQVPLINKKNAPVLYLVTVAISKNNSLGRENHGFGYHYHYCDRSAKRRSDILLTFSRKPPDPDKPVTWEPHAVDKADFEARVNAWHSEKRSSVHEACMRGIKGLQISDFKIPGKEAQLLLD